MTQKRTAWSVLVLAALLLLIQAVPAFADSRPYFISDNGSIFAGGEFDPGCSAGNSTYQAPDYSNPTGPTRYNGGILAFANVGGTRLGAHSTLDAMALGLIEGGGSDRGFYSGRSGQKDLSLANVDSTSPPQGAVFWGGMLDGSNTRRNHCIPDYYNTKKIGTPQSRNNIDLGLGDGQYQINNSVTFGGGALTNDSNGKKLTFFVNGNLTIAGDITYPAYSADNVPKLAIVVMGNIYIQPNVRNMNGWYIAQANGASGGEFWSCYRSGFSNPPEDTLVRQECQNTLNINGAVTARQVNLLRVNGGIGSSSPGTAAEVFNYTQDMVIGGPFFNQPSTPGDGIQSLISLPPVF